ncbi:hypothetical protein GCM10010112_27600 [Actinoplanes lobatus]|uniref:Uncharacterized protein n=1 Tax=Actinoplanes lobatus TaxID=113568 RepID=A0A7W7MIS1_9ACTN|nr:hypothetical protein [Actinoplanes lobatus]MBB4751804.1 hypothetical protein [Actinoplanes lobatus]GGN65811.1 hypothetical protein GCM10010112_27600 [Actinoplanes lobatus]GIE43384.1 hypothetical protein Alo02nite_62820 [Actinoplanes lobatus]
MNAWDRIERWSLRLAGTLVLAIGIGHAFLPTLGYPIAATDGMSPEAKDHFYYLGTYAIGTFLLGFAVLSFIYSTRPSPVFSTTMAAVWTMRLALEYAYPADVPIFLLQRPHTLIAPMLAIIAAAYTTATLAGLARHRTPAAINGA